MLVSRASTQIARKRLVKTIRTRRNDGAKFSSRRQTARLLDVTTAASRGASPPPPPRRPSQGNPRRGQAGGRADAVRVCALLLPPNDDKLCQLRCSSAAQASRISRAHSCEFQFTQTCARARKESRRLCATSGARAPKSRSPERLSTTPMESASRERVQSHGNCACALIVSPRRTLTTRPVKTAHKSGAHQLAIHREMCVCVCAEAFSLKAREVKAVN